MKNFLTIDHIGYAVRDIMTTARTYIDAGWTLSNVYDEQIQHTKIAFLCKSGMTKIELVQPLDDKPSPVDKFISNEEAVLYHICYIVEDVMKAIDDLHEQDFLPLFWPVESIAMQNKLICYLYNEKVGLIEIVNQ